MISTLRNSVGCDSACRAILGGSYGGYATLVVLTSTPDVFACGVDIVGVSNLNTFLAGIPPYWAPWLEYLARRVGDPRTEAGRALLTERSPLTRADVIARPLLIGQGANDPRVKQAESDQIVNTMKAKRLPVSYVLFPDEGHGFARPENRLAFFAVAEAFLASTSEADPSPSATIRRLEHHADRRVDRGPAALIEAGRGVDAGMPRDAAQTTASKRADALDFSAFDAHQRGEQSYSRVPTCACAMGRAIGEARSRGGAAARLPANHRKRSDVSLES